MRMHNRTVHGRKCLLPVCPPKSLGEQRKQLKCSPPSLVARLDFCVYGLSRRTAVAAEIEDMPPVREESTSIASFAGLTSSVDRPAIDTYVHRSNTLRNRKVLDLCLRPCTVPFYCACACAYCSSILYSIHKSILYSIHKPFCKSILYSIHKSFCKSIYKSILYSIHKPFCKSILYSIYKSFCKSILAINKTIFGINKTIFGINKTIFRINKSVNFNYKIILFCPTSRSIPESRGAIPVQSDT